MASITPNSIVCYLPAGGLAGNSTPVVAVLGRGLAVVQHGQALQPVYNKLLMGIVQPGKVSLAGGAVSIAGQQAPWQNGNHLLCNKHGQLHRPPAVSMSFNGTDERLAHARNAGASPVQAPGMQVCSQYF